MSEHQAISEHESSPSLKPSDLSGRPASLWIETAPRPEFPKLSGDLEVDVAIVGGGIVGITTAHLLKRAGRRVAVAEARRVATQVTGHTTAKITSQHGLIYARLVKSFGHDRARLYGEANQTAIERIKELIDELGIDCDFECKAAYTYSEFGQTLANIRAEAEAAASLGLPAAFVEEAPLPFKTAGAVRFDNQAQFHPLKYLLPIAGAIPGEGSHVFENTRVLDVDENEPCRVTTNRGAITARAVIVATNLPILDRGGFFAKTYPERHPVVSATLADDATVPDGMFYGSDQPSHSIRTHRSNGKTTLIVGGGGFKTGHADTEEQFRRLEAFVRSHFRLESIDYRWGNQDYMSMDGMPYIGKLLPTSKHIRVATGLNAWGMTGGTVAALILADDVLERSNPWAELFSATRVNPAASAKKFLSQNLDVGKEWVVKRLHRPQREPADLKPGEGALVLVHGQKRAAYRDESGTLHLLSPICPHLKCTVAWNAAERSWDCPCHGSRFGIDGEVLNGPALTDLERKPDS